MKYIMKTLIFPVLLCISTQLFAQEKIDHQIVGKWRFASEDGSAFIISFTAMQNYQVDFAADGEFDLNGTFKIQGDNIVIADSFGDCEGQEGVYTMSFEENKLTLTQVSDACSNRAGEDGVKREFTKEE